MQAAIAIPAVPFKAQALSSYRALNEFDTVFHGIWRYARAEITDIDRAPKLINDMAETVEKIGLSPFKF